jgi:hypothetical protein
MKLFNFEIHAYNAARAYRQVHHRPLFEFGMGNTPDDWVAIVGPWDIEASRINGRERCRCGMKPCLSDETKRPSQPPVLKLV